LQTGKEVESVLLKRVYPRSSGVLMPITSLHGAYGIGVLGAEAREFISFLDDAGFRSWQVLPVEHTNMCNSPYKCVSAFAGEPMLIDPDLLLEMELVTLEDIEKRKEGCNNHSVEYEIIREKQWELLQAAFSRNTDESYLKFNPFWMEEYVLYIAIAHQFEFKAWYDWPDDKLRCHDKAAVNKFKQDNAEKLKFYRFVQWLFDISWRKLRAFATERGISIVGDMPIYVAENSAEVWGNRELFNASADGHFAAIGGVPPDYFTPEGQCWGNPIYNWKMLKDDDYKWWILRVKASLERYDVVRLDHFRAFDSYYSIAGGSVNAIKGKWLKGPGMPLFKALKKELGDLHLRIIAEDLGDIGEGVLDLLDKSNLRGMRVLQFGFLGEEMHLPHNYTEACVAYTGTHDNTTLLAWVFSLTPEDRKKALFYTGFEGDWYIGGPNCDLVKAFMRTLFMSSASLAIVPIQDLLGYGADTRINVPGTPSGNWRFRIREGVLYDIDTAWYRELHEAYFRIDPVTEFAETPEKKDPWKIEYEE
jgi:4-alpha-glucanotransferase